MSLLPTLTSICVLACYGFARTHDGTTAGHMYVTYKESLFRYGMVDGVPQAKPDHVFHRSGGAVAVDRAGNLYADGRGGIVVFPPGGTKPTREIKLPPEYAAYSMTVDNLGYLYVSALAYSSGPRLFVYSPDAQSRAKPVVSYVDGPFRQMATDNAGDLFCPTYNAIEVHENARHGGQETRTILSPSLLNPTGIAINAGYIYVENLEDTPGSQSFVSVYPVSAQGKVRASRSILAPVSGSPPWSGELAVDSKYLYVFATAGQPQLFVYHKDAHGRTAPVSESPLPSASGYFAPVGTVGP